MVPGKAIAGWQLVAGLVLAEPDLVPQQRGRAVSGDEQRYRRVLARRCGADVDVKDLVVAENRSERGSASAGDKTVPRRCRAGRPRASALPPRPRNAATPRQREADCPAQSHDVPPTTSSGAFIHAMWIAAAVSVSVHIVISPASRATPALAIRKAGVAVPAMSRKIMAWSSRCRRRCHARPSCRGDRARWSRASRSRSPRTRRSPLSASRHAR